MRRLSLFATMVGIAFAATAAVIAVEAHDAPAAFMDIRDPAAASALANLRALAAEGRRTGTFPPASMHSTKECDHCEEAAATVFGLIRTDPALVTKIVDDLLCKHHNATTTTTTTASASIPSLSSCHEEVKKIVDELSKLAAKALNGGFQLPQVLCNDILRKCTVDCCDTPAIPEQIHLSLPTTDAAAQGLMAVSWTTLEGTTSSVVEWWPAASGPATASVAFGTNFTYDHGGWIGVLHTATMTNLQPATTYTYRVGNSAVGGPWSAEFNFTTFPANIGTPARPLRAIQIADMGCGDNAKPTIEAITERVQRGEIDIVLHPGDIGYDDGNEHVWDVYMRTMQPIASRVPYMVAPGNHECLWNFSAYKRRFPAMPSAMPDRDFDDVAMFYELRVGPFSFFMLDSESVIDTAEITPAQSAWFADAAMRASTAGRPILTMTHRPMYCSSGPGNCEEMAKFVRMGIEETLNRAGVLLHTTGHLHEYERTLPIGADGKTAQVFASNSSYVNPRAPTYIVNGAAGNPAGQNSFKAIQPWSVSHTLDVGYNVWSLTAAGTSNVTISSAFIQSVTGATVDSFTITRD